MSTNLGLLTDLYQLTMAYGYWKSGRTDDEAVFHLFYRRAPFGGAFAIACGMEPVLDFLENFGFEQDDLDYLATLTGNDGKPLFDAAFLEYLGKLELSCDVDAVGEGTVVFPHEPILRICGPLIQCQLLETALLNLVNFATLCATKAARICAATQGEPVLEFGLRRAQGMDGALTASRAAFIGGCAATSNVLAGKMFGVPVRGTHAHSWVMSFASEEQAFEEYAAAMPNNCIFLVDTYNTVQGVKNAIDVGRKMRAKGIEMVGIRLDSGDLCALSKVARKLLDEAGFSEAQIVASNDLDEYAIEELKQAGAKITLWGVGTKLVTAYDQPALGGVYKLAAIKPANGQWEDRVKLSEERIKISNPGMQQIRRFYDGKGLMLADVIYDLRDEPGECCTMVDQIDGSTSDLPAGTPYKDLLTPMLKSGCSVMKRRTINVYRDRAIAQLKQFPDKVKRLSAPTTYPVGLDIELDLKKSKLVERAGGKPCN